MLVTVVGLKANLVKNTAKATTGVNLVAINIPNTTKSTNITNAINIINITEATIRDEPHSTYCPDLLLYSLSTTDQSID